MSPPLVDLNVPWPQTSYTTPPTPQAIITLKNTLTTLAALGYTHVALNFTLPQSTKLPITNLNPIDLSHFTDLSDRLKLYTRITIVIDEPSAGQSLSKLQSAFDVVSVLPTSEKALMLACSNLDIDVLTFEYTKRLPAFLKHKTIGSAVSRGVKLEFVYAGLVTGASENTRAQCLNSVTQLVRASRHQNLVVSSGAKGSIGVRAFKDVYGMLELVGFKRSMERDVMEKSSRVLLSGRLRRLSYKQTVMVGEDVVEETGKGMKRSITEVQGGDVFKKQMRKLKEMK